MSKLQRHSVGVTYLLDARAMAFGGAGNSYGVPVLRLPRAIDRTLLRSVIVRCTPLACLC